MNLNKIVVPASLALLTLAPIAANADSLQNQKNTMRNITIGAGAVGLYGLLNHNSTLGLVGLAGAALAGSQYEKDRHQQSVQNNDWRRDYYRRSYNHRNGNSRYYHGGQYQYRQGCR